MAGLKKLTFKKTDAIQKKLNIGVADEVRSPKRSSADSQSGLTKPQKITDAWTRATPSQTKIQEKQSSVQMPEVRQDSRSQWTSVGGGRKSTTDAGKGSNRMFGDSSWSFDYDADPVKVAAAKKKEQEKPNLLTTLGGMFKSAGLREASNLSNTAGVGMDKRGGTAATSVYQDQLDMVDRQISAIQSQLKNPDTTASDRKDLRKALQEAQQQRKVYEDAIRANQQTGKALYGVSDEALKASQKQDQKNTQGLGAFGKSAVELGTGLMQAGMESAADLVTPGLSTVARAASVSGAASGAYRRSTDDYDVDRAQKAGTVAGAGVLAGGVLSKAVGSAGLGVLKALGKQNNILPNILTAGASGVGYAAGETGMGEISKALTYDDYEPDWDAIGTNLATSFAFSAVNSAIGMATASVKNKTYAQQLNSEAQRRYEQVQQIMQSGNAEQRAQGAASVMDGVEQLRQAVNGMHLVGAQKEVTAINRFLNSIDAEMAQYLPNGATVPGGALTPGTGLVPSQGAALAPQQAQRGTPSAMDKMEASYAVPPVDTVVPGSYNKGQKVSSAASPEVRQMETQAQVSQVTHPESQVLDAAATLFVEQGTSVPKAQEKAEIVNRLIAGEEVGPREINKLNPTSKTTQAIFTQLTGVQFPNTPLPTAQLFDLYRSAHGVAVRAETQAIMEAAAPEIPAALADIQEQGPTDMTAAPEAQMPEMTAAPETDIAVDSEEGREAFPGLNRLFDGGQTVTAQMAESGFRANPETQERIAQAQAELADAVNGTKTAASRKSGNTRNEIKLPDGETLTRDEFKSVARENYGKATDSQLDAMFNGLLARADRGETIPGLEDVAHAAKERKNERAEERSPGRDVLPGGGLRGSDDPGRAERSGEMAQRTGGAEGEARPGRDSRSEHPDARGIGSDEQSVQSAPDAGGSGVKEENDVYERRADLLHGGLRGESDSRPGEQGKIVSGKTGGVSKESASQEASKPGNSGLASGDSGQDSSGRIQQKEFVKNLRALKPKTTPVNLPGMKTVQVLPARYHSPRMKKFTAKIQRMGGRVYYCVGKIESAGGDRADGLFLPDDKTLLIRADTVSPLTQTQDHEAFHFFSYLDSSLQQRVFRRIFEAVNATDRGIDALDGLIAKQYAGAYADVFSTFDDDTKKYYYEEFVADLNGGIPYRILAGTDGMRNMASFFQRIKEATQAEVQAWEQEWDAAHPATQQNKTPSSTTQNNTEKPSFSLASEENRFFKTRTGVEVIKNPTNAEYRQLREEALSEMPWLRGTGEPMLRHTYDEEGNEYYWRADQAVHAQVEPYINQHFNTRTSQQWKWWEKADKDEYPIDYSKPQFSLASDDDDFPDFADLMDPWEMESTPEKFGTWDEALWHFENIPNGTMVFAETPGDPYEMKLMGLDDHGKWSKVLGVYPETDDGLAQFNKDLPGILSGNKIESAAAEKAPEEFKTWAAAYDAVENLPESSLAFDQPPIPGSEVSLGILDSHGMWEETLATYPVTPEGLKKINEDLPDLLNSFSISDEELNKLFPPQDNGHSYDDDGYGYNYEDEDADVPGFMTDLYARSRMEASDAVQTNRDGFAKTDTKAFKAWFHDPSGEFTNPDGQPKVFLRGSINMGATKAHDASVAKAQGIFFTTDPAVAAEYATGASAGINDTLMDAIKGDDNSVIQELQRKYFRGWGPAKDYILRHFQAEGKGLRLVGMTADGKETSKLADTEYFSLQSNTATPEQYKKEGWFAEGKWRELASFPKDRTGLEDFNYQLGDIIRENGLGIRGYGKYFLSGKNPVVIDAQGDDYHGIINSKIPPALRDSGYYTHIDKIAARAFQNGYDSVIIKNVDDTGGKQTQYIVKDSSQVKSVYNRGTWSEDNPDFLFSMATNDDHRQKLENFFHGLEEMYGEGSAEAMFDTFEELDRARQRAEERAADAEAAQQAAEWATDAAVEAAKMAEQAKAERRLKKQRDTYQERARQASAKARLEKANAVKSARLAEQMNAGRQWSGKLRRQDEKATAKMEAMKQSARERMDQLCSRKDQQIEDTKQAAQERMDRLRAHKDQQIEDTKLAERMNAGRQVSAAKRKAEKALAEEKARRVQDHKLAGKDAKSAASVLRKYHNADVSKLTNDPVDTLREAYHAPTLLDKTKEAADKLRTLHREFYKAFINGTQAIDDFSKYQKVDANTSVLLKTAMGSGSTVQSILQNHLVGKDGSEIDPRSLEDVVICWDGSGKHRKYNDDKQRILQDYMLHRHNIDRMSFRDKALASVEAYEQSYPWLTSLEPREFAELVADGNRIAQRYQELIEEFQRAKNKPIFQDENGSPVSADYSRSMVEQYEKQYDWVKDKAEGIYDWWDKFMQEWVVGETISPEEYAHMREIYPSYVPTYRKDKAGLGKGVSAFGGTVTAKRTVRKATGGTSLVANIEDSFVNLMEKNVKSQRTNMVLRSITDTAMLDEDGDFNGFTIFDWDDASEPLRWGLAAEGYDSALDAVTEQASVNALSKEGGVCKIRAWANGERVSAYVDPELYAALEFAFNPETSWFTKLGQKFTSPMKTFITGINPGFALRNTIRDNFTAQMNSISVVNSISGAAFEKYYARAWKEMVGNSENWQHFVDLGGTNAGYYNNEGGSYINRMRKQRNEDLNSLNMAGKALGFVGERTESVTRFAEYLASIDRLPGGDTYGNRLLGIKNAAEVTVDFSRKGTLGKAFNAWIPYWNPSVQGIDKMVRSFFNQPGVAGKAKILSRAALTTLPLDLLLYAVYKYLERDDEWEELSDRTKDAYYCIPLPDEHKFLKIPKSRDWGQIIGVPVMRMLQGLDGREDPFENYYDVAIAPNFLWSNPLEAIGLSTAYDLAKNKDFADRTIVPSNYAKMSKGDQWDSDTSKFAKKVSDVVNELSQKFVGEDWLSPMQLDYIISDYFGDFGDMFVRLNAIGGTDESLSPKEQAKQVAEDLVGNWVADNRYSSASVSDYYDLLDKISQELAVERVRNPEGYQDTPLYKLNAALNDKDNGPSTKISDLNTQVRNLPDGEEKNALKGQIVEIAREALQMYDAVQSGELQEPKLEMQYSKYGEKVSKELIDLKDYSGDYSFLPSTYKPKSYTDPRNKNKEYVLDEAAQAKYRELYDEEYQSVMEAAIKSKKYKSASPEERAELLEEARDDVASQVKDELLKWLRKNYESTRKKKK